MGESAGFQRQTNQNPTGFDLSVLFSEAKRFMKLDQVAQQALEAQDSCDGKSGPLRLKKTSEYSHQRRET